MHKKGKEESAWNAGTRKEEGKKKTVGWIVCEREFHRGQWRMATGTAEALRRSVHWSGGNERSTRKQNLILQKERRSTVYWGRKNCRNHSKLLWARWSSSCPSKRSTLLRSVFRNTSRVWWKWKIVKLVFLRKSDAEPKKGDQKLQDRCVDIGDVEVVRVLYYSLFRKRKRKRTWELEEIERGRVDKLPAPASDDDKFAAEPLGMAGRKSSHVWTWQSGTTNNVFGKLGHQDIFRRGEAEARRKNYGKPWHPRMVDCCPLARDVGFGRPGHVWMRREQFHFQSMFATGKCRSSSILAKNGHIDLGQRGGRMDQEKNGYSLRPRRWESQFCSFMWADNFWIMSHPKKESGTDATRLDWRSEKMGSGTQTSESVVDKHMWCCREMGHFDLHHNGMPQISFWRKAQDLGMCHESAREVARRHWRMNAVRERGILKGHSDIQKQGRPLEDQVQTTGGPCLRSLLFWEWELVMDYTDPWEDQGVGDQDNVASIPLQKTQWRNMGRISY